MKKQLLILFAFVALLATSAQAQNSDEWQVRLNKQVLLRSPAETAEPTITLSKSSVKKNDILTIQYTTNDGQQDWKRSFTINDANEQTFKELSLKNQTGTATLKLKELAKAAASNKPLYIYTMSLPKDPNQAALVRVRRILLCKIQWK
ncbi:hypothetical protein [Aridibaculum aurantiacum]|uniref:hypothetical protein n=1 Tax=Aridibaculum aurantiacum TaxID=2810307 RepID=UPI001A959F3F|nr:hypothetical protein [Aridibaculum aurantiacum]